MRSLRDAYNLHSTFCGPNLTHQNGTRPKAVPQDRVQVQMTVLVIGGAGYIGSHMVHALVDAGEPVVVIDNLSTGSSSAFSEKIPLFIGDIADENLVDGVIARHDVDAIIHFAGSVVVPDSLADPLGYYRNNTGELAQRCCEVATRRNVDKFIFSSTAAVYGNAEESAGARGCVRPARCRPTAHRS